LPFDTALVGLLRAIGFGRPLPCGLLPAAATAASATAASAAANAAAYAASAAYAAYAAYAANAAANAVYVREKTLNKINKWCIEWLKECERLK